MEIYSTMLLLCILNSIVFNITYFKSTFTISHQQMLQKIDKEKCINCSKVLCCTCSKKYEPDVFTELH